MHSFLEFILQKPFEFFVASVTLFYMFRGKHWHGIYVMYLLLGVYVAAKSLGTSQMVAGVILGVFANELFRIIRVRLDRENNP